MHMRSSDFVLGVDIIVLMVIFVGVVLLTALRALRDGDVSWSGLLSMVAVGLIGWGVASGFVVR